jgi:hypothetical protein
MEVVQSRNGVPIRLTDERWVHITDAHAEMAGYYYEVLEAVQDAQAVYEGKAEELLAVKEIEPGKDIVVVYREVSREDGFIITAFLSRGIQWTAKRAKLWPQ